MEMTRYSTEPRTRKYVKGYEVLSFGKKLSHKCGNQLLDTDTKSGLEALRTVTKKVCHKAAEEKQKKYWMNYEKYYKLEHYEISTLLNDSTASKVVTKRDRIDWLIR